jgi:EAL domain-containing protein (putative c-di-GMP-specific phosphodiesterase class I)
LKIFANHSDPNARLFINLSPTKIWYYCKKLEDGTNDFPPLMKEIIESYISPERIIIEITEDFVQNLEILKPILGIYRGFGYKLAINDLGVKSSNLDRIIIFRPDIIKVDMFYLRKSISDKRYEEILFTLSHLSKNLGVSVLFEGIETSEEFYQALEYGSRYVQGFLFDKALNDFIKIDKYEEKLVKKIKSLLKFKENQIGCYLPRIKI